MLAYYAATVMTPRTTRRMNTTIITSHMFWPNIMKLTSLRSLIFACYAVNLLAYYAATVTTPRSTRTMNTMISTSHTLLFI